MRHAAHQDRLQSQGHGDKQHLEQKVMASMMSCPTQVSLQRGGTQDARGGIKVRRGGLVWCEPQQLNPKPKQACGHASSAVMQ